MTKRVIVAEGAQFLTRDGLSLEPAPWEDGLRTDTKPGTFEWWYFDAHLDDGSTAVIVYLTKPLLQRTDPLTPTLFLTITRPDGKKLTGLPSYPANQFRAAREQCDVQIGPNWVRGDLHCYELHAEIPGVAADLTFSGIAPPWRLGAGKQYTDESLTHYFGWLPAIPFGTVQGTLTYDGRIHRVQGTGYHDHNWGNIALNEVFSYWYWGRAHLGDYTLLFAEETATQAFGQQKIAFLMVAKGDQIVVSSGEPLNLQAAEEQVHPSGKRYPRQLDFHWQGEAGTIHLGLRRPELIEAASVLITLPVWKRVLARLFVNPYYFRFNADLEVTANLHGETVSEHGRALFELMILH
jgi:predicted secreted hydrolase